MGKKTLSTMMKSVSHNLKRYSPEILLGLGVAGMVTTTVMAVKATPKALSILDNALDEKYQEEYGESMSPACFDVAYCFCEEFGAKEMIKATWKCYIPAAVVGVTSICCLIGAGSKNFRKKTALEAAYGISVATMSEYQNKVVEVLGEKKEKVIRDSIAKDKIEQNPVSGKTVIITDKGNTLCYDIISGRYFRTDIETVKRIVNELNSRLLRDMYICLNDFYFAVGMEEIKLGNEMGWRIEDGLIDLEFSSQLSSENEPCLVIDFRPQARYCYR